MKLRSDLILFTGLLTVLSFSPFAGMAQEDEEAVRVRNFLEVEHNLSTNFCTPHTAWAKPYVGGTTTALFFAPWFQGSTDAREIIELMQRADLDAKAVYVENGSRLVGDGRPDWYGGDPQAGTKRVERLLAHGSQVLWFNQVNLALLPTNLVAQIRQRVISGEGLVLVGKSETPPFEKAQLLPAEDGPPVAGRYYVLGKGLIAMLPSREKLEFKLGWETQFDYQMEQQVRALLWASKKEPHGTVALELPSEIAQADLPIAAKLNSADGARGTDLKVVLRRWDGLKQNLKPTATKSKTWAQVSMPLMREGDYHLDVFIRKGKAIANWTTMPFHVAADRHVQAVHLEKDWAEADERVSGQVHLTGNLREQDRVSIRLVDAQGRFLKEQELAANRTSVPFEFEIAAWMPMLLRVEAVIRDGKEEVSGGYAYLRVTQRHQDQFNFVMWGGPSGDLSPYGLESLARHGVTAILQQGPPPLALAASDLSYIPYTTSFRASSHTLTAMLDPATGLLKSGCVHDAAGMAAAVDKVVKAAQPARELGALAYSLGDENAVRASCLGPDCLNAYRNYLRREYGSIEALNREWDSRYADFAEIQLLTEATLPATNAPQWFKEFFAEHQKLQRTDDEAAKGADLEKQMALGDINDEMRALQAGNFARWYDRQAFQCYSYVEWCKQYQKAFRKLDPQARTGFEGTDSFTVRRLTTRSRQGGDLDAFVRELDYFGPYGGPANDVVRSLAPAGFPMGNWTGYDPDLDRLLGDYWGQITHGMNTVQWWRWDNLDGYHGYLAPTFAPFPEVSELLADTQVVRDGLGTLLMHSRMRDDGVAMLYSMPSTHIAHFDGNPTYGDYKRDHERWINLIHGAGVQFRYVTDRMLRLGEFDAAQTKVLILPLAFAIGTKEAEVIRNFVRNGGTVIADVRPGLYDGHCKPLERGVLDDVFGIERAGKQDAMEIDRLNVDAELAGGKARMKWGNWHGHDVYPRMKIDPTVAVTTGKPLGQAFHVHYWAGLNTPVCIVNQFGQGRAVLLNFSVFDAPMNALLDVLLNSAEVRPPYRLANAKGTIPRDVTLTRWANGKTELVSLLGPHDGEVTVNLPAAHFGYDLKARKALGPVSALTVPLRANRAAFYAFEPAESPAPELKLPSSASLGSVVTASVRVPRTGGQHAIRIRATTASGQPAKWLEQVLLVADQPIKFDLPFAHNDPPGEWKIEATDLYGNRSAGAKIAIH